MAKFFYIHREIEKIIVKAVNQFPAVVLTGPRQSGKSTMLKQLFSDQYKYVTFDDPLNRERALSDPKFFLGSLGEKVILDEIQYVPQLLSYVKIIIDENRQKKGRFIFTGSQQFNMIRNLGDTLAGRVAIFELLPFSIYEKSNAIKNKSFSSPEEYFVHSCLRGSFPEIVVDKKMDSRIWYSSYVQRYLERDIRMFFNIGDLRDFQRCLQLLASRTAQILNLSSLSAELGVAVNTVKKWISILEATRIIYLLRPYYRNIGKRITKSPKIYFLDCGLVSYLLSINNREFLLNGPMAGALFENFCIQETIKVIMNYNKRAGLYYLRSHNGFEVDLIIEKDGRLYPVEFKLTKTPAVEMGSAIKRFRQSFTGLPVMSGKIVSLCEESIPLSPDLSIASFDDYLAWLQR